MDSTLNANTYKAVKSYADACIANDLEAIVENYHDEVTYLTCIQDQCVGRWLTICRRKRSQWLNFKWA